ncbi:MAG TPA: L,D-transpeptidase [Actinomycetota bacterium]|nr:L,D-transpeptidase [Actinomycetota bacterium]
MTKRIVLALVGLGVLVPALPAAAATSLSINASASQITYGQIVTLSGTVDPVVESEVVELVDAATLDVIGSDQTDAAGAYTIDIAPSTNVTVKARALPAESSTIDLAVKPVLTASLTAVRLFGRARITGTIQPPHDGSVHVRLLRGTTVMREGDATLTGGAYSIRLPVRKPGTYRAEVTFDDQDHAAVKKLSAERRTPLPYLKSGSRGIFVLLLERRLRDLRYRHPLPNRSYDHKTGDAVLAFRKVQGMRRNRVVTRAVWRRLASPRRPKPRTTRPRFHIEVDQTKQVLYVVRRGKIVSIIHASTGGAGVGTTYDGRWRVHRQLAGYSPNRLYYPSYFHGQRAIHGWPDVPPTAASHGCVRVPMWTAVWIYDRVDIGDVIRIYHS